MNLNYLNLPAPFGNFWHWTHNDLNVTGSNFEITFMLEKHVVEDDVLFTNHLVGK